jgi:tRNA modification GTPase
VHAPARKIVRELIAEISAVLGDGGRGERLREGMTVAISGPPNAGKSTLLNRIARREAAIVSPFAGTTRDVIEVHLDLGGYPVTLLDTAGIRESDDPVEQEGVRRARERAGQADLVLWLTDACAAAEPPAAGPNQAVWRVRNKVDLENTRNESKSAIDGKSERRSQTKESIVNKGLRQRHELEFIKSDYIFNVSALTGQGFEGLLTALQKQAEAVLGGAEPALVTRARQRRALEGVLRHLQAANSGRTSEQELLAEDLRLGSRELGRVLGRTDIEEILDVIFRDFCIGK